MVPVQGVLWYQYRECYGTTTGSAVVPVHVLSCTATVADWPATGGAEAGGGGQVVVTSQAHWGHLEDSRSILVQCGGLGHLLTPCGADWAQGDWILPQDFLPSCHAPVGHKDPGYSH